MKEKKYYFDEVKKDRGWYFVEYCPPMPSFRFATLNLVITDKDRIIDDVAKAMENEARDWILKYPISIMVSSFDYKGDLIGLNNIHNCSHLISYIDPVSSEVLNKWELLKDEDIPDTAGDKNELLNIYKNFNYRTSDDLKKSSDKYLKERRVGWYIVFFWAVVLPAIVAVLEFYSPKWVAVIVLIFGLYKAAKKALELLGKVERSQKDIAKEDEQTKVQHHHYHCKQNPEGFLKLKLKNFECDAIERIKKENSEIKSRGNGQS